MFTEIFNGLLEENGLNRKQFAERSGIPYTTVIGWTTLNRLPDYTALVKIADFFDCSLDYITEREGGYSTDHSAAELSDAEKSLLKDYKKLNVADKELVENLVSSLSKKHGNK